MGFKEYIGGKRHGKEANRLEREAMEDPFLQEAIEGYDSLGHNPMPAIDELERRMTPHKTSFLRRRLLIGSVAAVLFLLISIPLFLRKDSPHSADIRIASSEQPVVRKNEFPPSEPSPQNQGNQVGNKEKELHPTDKSERKKSGAVERQGIGFPGKTVSILPVDVKPEQTNEVVEEMKKTDTVASAVASEEVNIASLPDNRGFLRGRIVNETGEPIVGANIYIKNTPEGVITDTAGFFKLSLRKNETQPLLASFIGYRTKEIPVKEVKGNIILTEDKASLSEMVVVGYGKQKKATTTGLVSPRLMTPSFFGKAEFIDYFKRNSNKALCRETVDSIVAEFYIDRNGRPDSILIKEMSCPDIEPELKRLLLISPLWSERDRKVELKMVF